VRNQHSQLLQYSTALSWSLEAGHCRDPTLLLSGPRVFLKSTAELFDAVIIGISLASVFISGIPNVNILRILR